MRVKISYEVELPDIPHTNIELQEYLRYAVNYNGQISIENPFYQVMETTELEPLPFSLEIEVQK